MHVIGRRVVAHAGRAGRDDGAIAILVALLSVALFGFGALVVDIGHAEQVRSQAQNTVDAASLAGVRVFASGGTTSEVADAVKSYVSDNMGITNWAGCTDPTPLTLPADADTTDTCISTLTSTNPGVTSYQVRVKLPVQHVQATFGGLFGVSSIAVSPISQALSGQPLPPTCGPCDPALDESTGQPKPQPPPTGFPFRSELPDPSLAPPDPAAVPPAGPLDPDSGCPTTPGLFTPDIFPTGVTVVSGFSCTLKPGLYVFDNTNLDVQVNSSIASFLSDGSDGLVVGTGVTLLFYGTGTMTVEGMIGTPVGSVGPPSLIASVPSLTPQPGQPIPGVAIVFDQFDQSIVAPRTFTLGDHFGIKGSVYALDGHTTWATAPGDCPAVGSTCWVHDEGAPSVIATTTTAFADTGRIPTIGTDHPMTEPPPSPPHLVK